MKRNSKYDRHFCSQRPASSHEVLEQRLPMAAWDLTTFVANSSSPVSLSANLGSLDKWHDNHSGAALYNDVSGDHFLLVPANNDDSGDQNNPGLKVYPLSSTYAAASMASAYIDLEEFQDVESIVALGGGFFAITEEKRWDITAL